MPILCRHVQVYTLGRLSIDWWFFFRASSSIQSGWIFSKLDSGFQSLAGFRILSAGFWIPKPRIPDSTSTKFVDSGIRIPLHGAIFYPSNSPFGLIPFARWFKSEQNLILGFLHKHTRAMGLPCVRLRDFRIIFFSIRASLRKRCRLMLSVYLQNI